MSRTTGLISTLIASLLFSAGGFYLGRTTAQPSAPCDDREFTHLTEERAEPGVPMTFSQCMVAAERDRIIGEYAKPRRL